MRSLRRSAHFVIQGNILGMQCDAVCAILLLDWEFSVDERQLAKAGAARFF